MQIIQEETQPTEQYYEQPPRYEQLQQTIQPQMDIPAQLPNSDPDFMRWLFDLKERVVTPLKYAWMGYEAQIDGSWKKKVNSRPIMNSLGINWCTELIESYINPAYIISNYNDKWFNYTMRLVTRVIFQNLTARHKDFELNKLDIENVGLQIESKIQALLLGARGDGYRQFFSKTRQEQVVVNKNETQQTKKPSGSLLGLFGHNNNSQEQL